MAFPPIGPVMSPFLKQFGLGNGGAPAPALPGPMQPAPFVPQYGPANPNPVPPTAGPAPAGGSPVFDVSKMANAFGLDPSKLSPGMQGAPTAFDNAIKSLGVTPDQVRDMAKKDQLPDPTIKKDEQKIEADTTKLAADEAARNEPPPAQYIAAGWDPSRNPIRPETMKKIESAQGQQLDATRKLGDVQSQAAAEQAATIENYQRIQENQHLVEMQAQQKRDDARKAQEMRISELQDEARNSVVDQKKAVNDAAGGGGALGWVTALAGATLGGMFRGFNIGQQGGPQSNEFIDSFNKQVDMNIMRQKEGIVAKQGKVADAQNVYSRMLNRFGDERSAEAATRSYYGEQVKTELARLGANNASEDITARRDLALGQMGEEQAKEHAKLVDMAEFVPGHVIGGGAGAADKNRDKIFEYDGQRYEARSTEQAAKMADGAKAASEFKRLASQLDVLRDDPATYASVFGVQLTDKSAEAANISERMITQLSTMANSGTINAGEYDRYKNQLGDPNALTSRAGMKGKQWSGMIDKSMKDNIRSNAVEQVKTGYKTTPAGKVAPTADYTGTSPTKTTLPSTFKGQ